MTTRVHEVATELGVDAKTVLARLAEMGESLPSASSVLTQELAQQLRDMRWAKASLVPAFVTPAPRTSRIGRSKTGVYKGPPLRALDRAFLDLEIARRSHPVRRNPGQGSYYVDEVELAKHMSEIWAGCLFAMTPPEIVAWSKVQLYPQLPPKAAVELHERGVKPDDVGWHYDDRGQGTLADRLASGAWTVNQVVAQVEWRREHPET